MKSAIQQPTRTCPYCSRQFKKFGNHLPYCKMRHGRDYSVHLSQRTLCKNHSAKKQQCPHCVEWWKRLDTHLRLSALCRQRTASSPEQEREASLLESTDNISHHQHSDKEDASTQQPSTGVMLHHHLPPLNRSPSPSPPMLKPFTCPTTDQAWVDADQELATLVVPAVFNASSIEEKHLAFSRGIYSYFSKKYRTRTAGKGQRGRDPTQTWQLLKKPRRKGTRPEMTCDVQRGRV